MASQKINSSLKEILQGAAHEVAPRLLGCILERELDGQIVRAKIVETEAYDQTDEASHSFRSETMRTKVMFGEPGFLYVYFTYGMHYCCNVVVGEKGYGAAVLIRAVEPLTGIEVMEKSRPGKQGIELTNGPAKLCQALAVDKQLNGHDLRIKPIKLIFEAPVEQKRIIQTTRIGISQAKEKPWRFYLKDSPCVSNK